MSVWFPTAHAVADPRLMLLCLPPGGGDVSFFSSWQRALGEDVAVNPAALPGHGRRVAEPLMNSISDLADGLLEPALRATAAPLALFGHSLGALVAFELAHRLTAAGRPPVLLIVSGSPAPQSHPRTSQSYELSDEEFLDSVIALGGVSDGLLDFPDMRSFLLPILRADFAAAETYHCPPRPLLDIPFLVLGGNSDPSVHRSELDLWCDMTSGPSEVAVFDGGHFYLVDQLSEVLSKIRAVTGSALARHYEREGTSHV
ncbi:thioesterase II family protein [Kutzneria sp. CA-103260]|uniref:thioesterase II family protein n=1 Tax=Kutzneria sp. CA-103260 TaxID=2802641 RepID=UPI001BA5CE3E|nr:alpha/beta fold hydrolase [Kutzneria sp. CA-103260]QUQ67498.1 thioesterase [Kutzneria sp. CA-103260]